MGVGVHALRYVHCSHTTHMASRDRRLVARVTTVTLALREDRTCQQRAVDPGRPRPLVCYGEP
jgi:hypothetical protein